ncbi:hypothetical protein R6Q59_003081 [Mikania micrantha]
MLRAYSNLPSISLYALKLSLCPILSSSSRRICTVFASSPALLFQTFNSSKRVLRMMDHPSPRASASYSSGSSNDFGRELLVQHLLVKEEDKDLLYDLQKRLIRGPVALRSDARNLTSFTNRELSQAPGEDLSDLAVEYSKCHPRRKVVCLVGEASVLDDIQPEELHAKLQDPDFLEDAQLIDVREPHEVDSFPSYMKLLNSFLNALDLMLSKHHYHIFVAVHPTVALQGKLSKLMEDISGKDWDRIA